MWSMLVTVARAWVGLAALRSSLYSKCFMTIPSLQVGDKTNVDR